MLAREPDAVALGVEDNEAEPDSVAELDGEPVEVCDATCGLVPDLVGVADVEGVDMGCDADGVDDLVEAPLGLCEPELVWGCERVGETVPVAVGDDVLEGDPVSLRLCVSLGVHETDGVAEALPVGP